MDKNGSDRIAYASLEQVLKIVKNMDNFSKLVYISGGIVPYLYLGVPSMRMHYGLHFLCEMENINEIREIVKKNKVYIPERDSLAFDGAKGDYGLNVIINDVPVDIFPFEVTADGIKQYSYDWYNRECNCKLFPKMNKSDYISIYKTPTGGVLMARSLEVIAINKYLTNRPKDKIDFGYLSKCELDREKFDRVKESFVTLKNNEDIYNQILFIEPTAKVMVKTKKDKRSGFVNIFTIVASMSLIAVIIVVYLFNK